MKMINEDAILMALVELTKMLMTQNPYDNTQWVTDTDYYDDMAYRANMILSRLIRSI